MSEVVTAVVAALPEEIRPVQDRLQKRSAFRLGRYRAIRGVIAGKTVVTMATGDGGTRARQGLNDLLSNLEARVVLAIGIAGGLSEDLGVGDVVAAGRVFSPESEVPAPDSMWLDRAQQLDAVTLGSIYSHSEIAIDPVAKRSLWEQAGREPAQVVDLETASYARTASAAAVPYVALRAVSDSFDEALPLDFNRFRKPDGSSDRGRILRYVLIHPSIVPELMQLRERLRHCARRLAELVEEILSL